MVFPVYLPVPLYFATATRCFNTVRAVHCTMNQSVEPASLALNVCALNMSSVSAHHTCRHQAAFVVVIITLSDGK